MKKESTGLYIWRMIYPILIFLGVDTLLTYIVMFAYMYMEMAGTGFDLSAAGMQSLLEGTLNFTYSNALYLSIGRSAICIPVFFILMRMDVKRDKKYEKYVEYTSYNKAYLLILPLLGIAVALGFNNLVVIIVDLLQAGINAILNMIPGIDYVVDLYKTYNESSDIIYAGSIFVQILSTCICAPLVEESLFRGLLYKRMRTRLKMIPSILISAAIFGIIHGNLVQFIYAFFIGVILAFVYEKFKTIWAPIILHAGANLLSVIYTMILGEDGIGMPLWLYIIITAIELAIAFLLMLLIQKKVNRRAITPEEQMALAVIRPKQTDNFNQEKVEEHK